MAGMTIKDIAKKCGVGVSTVSRAMNDHPDINQETKDKILRGDRRVQLYPQQQCQESETVGG